MLGDFACVWNMCWKMEDGSVSCLVPFVPYAAEGQGRGWAGEVCVRCMLACSQNNESKYEVPAGPNVGCWDCEGSGRAYGCNTVWRLSCACRVPVCPLVKLLHRLSMPTTNPCQTSKFAQGKESRTHFSTYLPACPRTSSRR